MGGVFAAANLHDDVRCIMARKGQEINPKKLSASAIGGPVTPGAPCVALCPCFELLGSAEAVDPGRSKCGPGRGSKTGDRCNVEESNTWHRSMTKNVKGTAFRITSLFNKNHQEVRTPHPTAVDPIPHVLTPGPFHSLGRKKRTRRCMVCSTSGCCICCCSSSWLGSSSSGTLHDWRGDGGRIGWRLASQKRRQMGRPGTGNAWGLR